jgi:effector-binding domain-containing protein
METRNESDAGMVVHKVLEEVLVAQTRIHGKVSDLADAFSKLHAIVGDAAAGSPIVVHHWGVSDEAGHDMDVCLPLKKEVSGEGITITNLPKEDAMTIVHRGSYSEIGSSYNKATKHLYERGHPMAESTREVYHHWDNDNPEDSVVEVQEVLHDWTRRFSTKLEEVLGAEIKDEVLSPMSNLNIDTPTETRQKALCKSLKILESKTNHEQQYEILSHCAHVFPVELIPPMRDVYKSTGSVDAVIEAMVSKGGFYPKLLRREGSIIYSEKGPSNPTAYKEAKTEAEKRRAYCFCPLIRDSLDETPEIFCNCSAGWPKQLWEGILEQPLKVDIVQSLTKGDEICEFAIHLPEEIS